MLIITFFVFVFVCFVNVLFMLFLWFCVIWDWFGRGLGEQKYMHVGTSTVW